MQNQAQVIQCGLCQKNAGRLHTKPDNFFRCLLSRFNTNKWHWRKIHEVFDGNSERTKKGL